VAKELDGPIRVTGHSAGGHLATRMMCETTPLATDVTNRIDRVVSISGVHDLRPLMQHSMNEKLGLTDVTATTESPALLRPLPGKDVIAWVGAHERPEFLRQSALLVEHWRQCGVSTRLVADPDKHHFDVIDGLKSADHPLTQCLVGA
jgi:acetyl esterase/lipase